MNETAEIFFQLLLGFAHAIVAGVFLVAAAGKLAVCKPDLRAMCVKGCIDAALALLACLFVLPGAGTAGAIAAVTIGAGGWLREKIKRNTVCNCFGVLTSVLHPWRNGARAALFAGGLIALFLAPHLRPGAPALWMGAVLGLSGLLVLTALVFARHPLFRLPVRAPNTNAVMSLEEGTIAPATVVGTDENGRALALRDLAVPGKPIVLLLASSTCKPCQWLKQQIAPLLPGLPYKLYSVIEGERGTQHLSADIFDPDAQWRKALGVKSVPALVVVNESMTNLADKVASGSDAILLQLLQLALQQRAQDEAGSEVQVMEAA
jgi:hypothetical protein